jgi:AraC-like DNA-binding protein
LVLCHAFLVTTPDDTFVKSELLGKSLDQARAMYENTYNGDSFDTDLTAPDFSYRYTATGNADMTLRSSQFNGFIHGSIEPQDEYVLMWMTAGEGVIDIGANEVEVQLGRPRMFPTGRRFEFEMTELRQNLVHFRAGYLEQVAAEEEGSLPGPLMFDHTSTPDGDRLRQWKQTIGTVAKTVLGGTPPSPLLQAEVTRMAAVTLLNTFAHDSVKYEPVLLAPRNARLRVAVEYIRANARLPLSPTGVAREAGLSPRGLQQAFANQLGTTPTQYIRTVRLEYARADLVNSHPEHVTVADIADRWGFVHHSRFASAYAEKYGEYPSDTLRR